jgi:hypothetical protein
VLVLLLPQVTSTACCSTSVAVYGLWAVTSMGSWGSNQHSNQQQQQKLRQLPKVQPQGVKTQVSGVSRNSRSAALRLYWVLGRTAMCKSR